MVYLGEKEKIPLQGENIKIFSGNSNFKLAKDICEHLEIPLGKALVSKFTNEEIRVKIEENVRGYDCIVIQSICRPVNDNLMELLIIIDALSRASAKSITAVVPHYGYAKQEKKTSGREPITAKLVANLITVAGADRLITIDLHAGAIQGFFDIPVDNLMALTLFIEYYSKRNLRGENIVVVSPDAGGVAPARLFADRLDASLAIIFKRRPRPDEAEVIEMVGDVRGKTAIIMDDMISTGKTLIRASEMLKEKGALAVYTCLTHPLFVGDSIERIKNSNIEEVLITDTIPVCDDAGGKIVVLSVAPLLGEAIRRSYFNLSISKLFS